MPMCKFCGKPFAWGNDGERWVPLIPVEEHAGYDRQFQDENGMLRAAHHQVCVHQGGPAVRVARLAVKVPASDVIDGWSKPDDDDGVVVPRTRGRPRKRRSKGLS
jgi:hypothetical protein